MKAKVIHIKGDLRTFDSELDSFGIDYEVFDGIVKDNAYEGISESFKSIVINSTEDVLIFEDDVKFTSVNSRRNWNLCVESLPSDWDILLGGSYQFDLKEDLGGILKVGDFSSLHCTLINKKCFDKVLEHDCNNIKHLDRYLGSLSKQGLLNVYLCNPQIAVQYNGHSRTRNKNVNYDYLLTNKNILK